MLLIGYLVKHGTECCNAMTALHGYQKLYLDARAHVDLNWILHYCDKAFYHVMQSLRQMERELSAERIHASVASTKKMGKSMGGSKNDRRKSSSYKCTSGQMHFWAKALLDSGTAGKESAHELG